MDVRVLLVFLALAAPAVFAQAKNCRTALGVPCFTVRGTHTQWQLFRNGPADIRKFTSTSVNALRSDGSSVTVRESRFGHLFSSGNDKQKQSSLYLAPEKQIVTLNHTARTIARREPLIWHDLPFRRSADGDASCQSGIRHSGTDFTMKGTATVAGVPVVKWYRSLANGGSEEIYLAPSLDCLTLKAYSGHKNAWRLPTFVDSWEVSSVELGDPSPSLFALPSEYRPVEDSSRLGLLRFVEENRRRGVAKPAP